MGSFMQDPGLRHWIEADPSSDSDSDQSQPAQQPRDAFPARANTSQRLRRPSSVHESTNDDSDNSLVANRREPKKRKRRTKAQIEIEKMASSIRDVTDEPPKLGLNPRQIRELGAAGVGNLEEGQSLFKARTHDLSQDFSQNTAPLTFDDLDKTTDRYKRRINKTDSSGYKKQKLNIGLNDIDDSDEYSEDPVLWAGRDKALKTAIDFQGNQVRADASTLGHATPSNFSPDGITALLSPICGDDAESTNMRRASRAQTVGFNIRLDGDDDDDTNSLFGDAPFTAIEDVENAIEHSDIISLDRSPSQARALERLTLPKTSKPLDWGHADGWARTLREQHGFDFTQIGGRLDHKKILGTHELPPPEELKRLDQMDVEAEIDEDDQLFMLITKEHERKEKEKEQRQEERAAILKRHQAASTLFQDLRACVMTLIGNREKRRHEQEEANALQMRIPDLGAVRPAPSLSVSARAPRTLTDQPNTPTLNTRPVSQQARVPTGPRYGQNQEYRRDEYPAPRHRVGNNRENDDYGRREQDQRASRAQNNQNERYRWSEDDRGRPRGVHEAYGNDGYRREADTYRPRDDSHARERSYFAREQSHRGDRSHSRPDDRYRSDSVTARYNDPNYRMDPARLPSQGRSRGGRGPRPSNRGRQWPGPFEWEPRVKERKAPADFKPWNPDADELDPIKKQFGGK